jgi:hypothetical protein
MVSAELLAQSGELSEHGAAKIHPPFCGGTGLRPQSPFFVSSTSNRKIRARP